MKKGKTRWGDPMSYSDVEIARTELKPPNTHICISCLRQGTSREAIEHQEGCPNTPEKVEPGVWICLRCSGKGPTEAEVVHAEGCPRGASDKSAGEAAERSFMTAPTEGLDPRASFGAVVDDLAEGFRSGEISLAKDPPEQAVAEVAEVAVVGPIWQVVLLQDGQVKVCFKDERVEEWTRTDDRWRMTDHAERN